MPLPSPRPIVPTPGSTPDPANVVGRDDTIELAYRLVSEGNDLLLADPRRMGKTAMLDRMCRTPPKGWDAAHIDFQGVKTTAELTARAFEHIKAKTSLPQRTLHAVSGFFANTTLTAGKDGLVELSKTFAANPVAALEKATLALDRSLADDDRHLLLAWDELPDVVENIAANDGDQAGTEILQTLRRIRQATDNIRWIVCGSVGFHHVRRSIGAPEDVVNDMVNLPFGPLTDDWGRWLAHSLLLSFVDDPQGAVVVHLARRTGNIPYLLHHLTHHLRLGAAKTIERDDIDRAFVDFVNNTDQSHGMTHFLTRLGDYYGEDADGARRILDHLCPPDTTADVHALGELLGDASGDRHHLHTLLDLLKLDHYVAENTDHEFTWRYPVLAEIWRQRSRL